MTRAPAFSFGTIDSLTVPISRSGNASTIASATSKASVSGTAETPRVSRFRIPVSLLDIGRLSTIDLDKYDVLVHPGGTLTEPNSDALVEWTTGGGSLIAMSGAVDWARNNELLDIESKPFDTDALIQGLPYDQLDEARGAHRISGSIFAMLIDTTHPVGFGLREALPVFHIGSQFYEVPESPGQGLGIYSDSPLLSGYISDDKLEQLVGSAGAVAARSGEGRVIAFMDRLSFRAYWYGSQRLFLNAVFFSRAF